MEINVKYLDEIYLQVQCEESISRELHDHFSYHHPNPTFVPSFQAKRWDGIIRLYNLKTQTIYTGLRDQVKKFAKRMQYSYSEDDIFSSDSFSIYEAQEWLAEQKLTLEPRDYQLISFIKAIRDRRRLFVSPTNSGKSFIIYLIIQYLQKKTLLIVPSVSLIHQMTQDFMDYDPTKSIDLEIHHIHEGKSHKTDKRIVLSTWQSIYEKPANWFKQFDCIIGDEVHRFKADSLVTLMKKTYLCRHKFGFTGTLDNIEANEMVLEGLFGKIDRVTTNKELIDRKISADIFIKSIILDYPISNRIDHHISTYEEEVDFLVGLQERNNFIANLANSLDGNVMVLFKFIEKHGDLLNELLIKKNNNRTGLYYIHGGVNAVYRNDIRAEIEAQDNAIILASLGTFAEGINIKRLNHIIFATPTKSRIKVLQSIGRGLRRSDIKEQVTLFDISDDLSYNNIRNYTLKHYFERRKIYEQEQFPYKQYKVKVK